MNQKGAWLKRTGQIGWFNAGVVPSLLGAVVLILAWSGTPRLTGSFKVTLTLTWLVGAVFGDVVSAVTVRCHVCGWRPVAFGPASRLRVASLDACPHCHDDGSGRIPISRLSPHWGGGESERLLRQLAIRVVGITFAVTAALVGYAAWASERNVTAELAEMRSHTSCSRIVDVVAWEISQRERSLFREACDAVAAGGASTTITLHGLGNDFFPRNIVLTISRRGEFVSVSGKVL